MIRFSLILLVATAIHVRADTPYKSLPPSGTTSTVTYDCRHVKDGAVEIDGDLSDVGWKEAVPMENFQTAHKDPKQAKNQTTARLLWSNKHLFVAFECRTDATYATLKNRDDDIWTEECAEIYLCPRGPEAKYYEIDWSPENVIYDSLLHSYQYNEQTAHYKEWARAYNPKIKSVTKKVYGTDGKLTGWILEAAIPFTDLAEAKNVPPKTGDLWLFNACRIEKLTDKESEYSYWQSTLADFHRPWTFPQLRYTE